MCEHAVVATTFPLCCVILVLECQRIFPAPISASCANTPACCAVSHRSRRLSHESTTSVSSDIPLPVAAQPRQRRHLPPGRSVTSEDLNLGLSLNNPRTLPTSPEHSTRFGVPLPQLQQAKVRGNIAGTCSVCITALFCSRRLRPQAWQSLERAQRNHSLCDASRSVNCHIAILRSRSKQQNSILHSKYQQAALPVACPAGAGRPARRRPQQGGRRD